MIEILNTWAKNLGLAIVIISILEMLLPNNKTKKYIKTVMGIYILFCIISPWIENKNILKTNVDSVEGYIENQATINTSIKVNQTSMDQRIQELYIEELEKDITKKLKEKGYEISKCKVSADISNEQEEVKINKIKINISKKIEREETEESIENKIVTEIQKIKTVDTSIKKEESEIENENESKITSTDIKSVKQFLIDEYGVSEKCLEIS